jgi:hypothetical protein
VAYDLAALIPGTRATWLLVAVLLTAFTFALFAAACDRSGRTIIASFLAAGVWLFGAFAFLVWFWR